MSQEGIMTRETKIGLLVGLAFIIVVGILLSDHVADSSRPQQAILSDAGNNVRDSVAIPQPAAVAAPIVAANSNGPTSPVPTQEEVRQPQPQAQQTSGDNVVVRVGPGGNVQSLTQDASMTNPPAQQQQQQNQTTLPLEANDGAVADNNPPQIPQVSQPSPKAADATPEPAAKILKQYKAASGDTLAKIARHFYGNSSHASIEAILAANPQLKGNAAHLAAGRTYAIPALDSASHTAKNSSVDENPQVAMVDTNQVAVGPTTRQSPKALAEKHTMHGAAGSYTVKSGDTLWKIAVHELGSSRDIKEIEELNPGALKHGQLKVGAVLKMPAKTVASAD